MMKKRIVLSGMLMLVVLSGSITGCKQQSGNDCFNSESQSEQKQKQEEVHILDFFEDDQMPDSQNVIEVNQTRHYEGFTGIDPDMEVYIEMAPLDVTVREVLVAPEYCYFLVKVEKTDGTLFAKGDFSKVDESVVKMCSDMYFDFQCTYTYGMNNVDLHNHDEASFDHDKEYNDGYYVLYAYTDSNSSEELPNSISLIISNLEIGYPYIEAYEGESVTIMDEYDMCFNITIQE